MTTQAKATFDIKQWDEKSWGGRPYGDVEAPKMTHAEVIFAYKGDFVGESKLQFLMQYNADGRVYSVGLEEMKGTLAGRSGTFVLQHQGLFSGESNNGTFTIIPGSGTGEFVGVEGSGQTYSTSEVREITFEYTWGEQS